MVNYIWQKFVQLRLQHSCFPNFILKGLGSIEASRIVKEKASVGKVKQFSTCDIDIILHHSFVLIQLGLINYLVQKIKI